MYKDFKTTIITGGIGSGKTYFIKKYIDELINQEDLVLYLVDPKMVELFEYKNKHNIIYVNTQTEFNSIFDKVKNSGTNKKKYIFIDEIADLYYDKTFKNQIKYLLTNKQELSLELIITTQQNNLLSLDICEKANTVIQLNKI